MRRGLLELAQNVLVTEQVEFLLAQLDRAATVLRQQDLVTYSTLDRDQRAVRRTGTGPHRHDLTFILLLGVGIRQVNATRRLGDSLETLDEHAVAKGNQFAEGALHRHKMSTNTLDGHNQDTRRTIIVLGNASKTQIDRFQ